MSAAATAAGYLYASGRLRGRAGKEEAQKDEGPQRKKMRVAALPERVAPEPAPQQPKRTPTIQYRTRRWRPDV
ncbi:MAG TPA: hypothetical protein VEB41_05690 [Burkholderiales bacterium]|nr:hypothetical protein [Burkholderiales bacterium]